MTLQEEFEKIFLLEFKGNINHKERVAMIKELVSSSAFKRASEQDQAFAALKAFERVIDIMIEVDHNQGGRWQ